MLTLPVTSAGRFKPISTRSTGTLWIFGARANLTLIGFVGDCDRLIYRPIWPAHGRIFRPPHAAIEVKIALELSELETFHTTFEQADFALGR